MLGFKPLSTTSRCEWKKTLGVIKAWRLSIIYWRSLLVFLSRWDSNAHAKALKPAFARGYFKIMLVLSRYIDGSHGDGMGY